ncbi:amylo-alpha-1,6-glucosidase [Sphaerisporangium viridialbum]|uniref:amylo-alpha-1,6-glucosidase n=1 Tax=Sphaerisporangium viridialbum TaxID=46189 RepID=UPI003C706D4A
MAATIPEPRGWNTWDVEHHTAWVHLPTGLRARFALRSPRGEVFDGFTWRRGLVRLGHHTPDGGYCAVTVHAHGTELRLQARGGDDELDVLADRGPGAAELVLLLDEAPGFGGAAVAVREEPGKGIVVEHGGGVWLLECSSAPGVLPEGLVFRGDAAEIRLSRTGAAGSVRARVGRAMEEADAARLRTSGWLGDAGDAMTRALTWNTIFAPDLGRVLTPTSRDFVCRAREGFYGRWALHTWDTFFTGLVAAWADPAYAEGIFAQILDQAGADGMLPNRVSDDLGRTDDRSQPPVGAYTVLKAYLGSGLSGESRRRELLQRAYPVLRDWHAWWASARRGPHGLLAWGSDPVEGDPGSATIDRARRESGLDDSPMYDDAVLDEATHTMNLADAGLNALYVADAEALARIAGLLGHAEAAETLARDGDRLAERTRDLLWDTERGRYGNRWADGRFSGHTSPTLLYPLLAGLPDPERAEALVNDLLSPGTLGGDPPLPSTARDDPGFSTRYWRGRVWAPMAFLAVEGLRRYGLDGHSGPIVDALLRLFLREWTEHSHVRENYPIVPGEDVRALEARSDGLMGWGGLLGYLAVQELADPRPEGWRFAHPRRRASVEGLALSEGRLAVRAGDRLAVELDSRPLLDLPAGAEVTGYERASRRVRGVVTLPEPGDFLAGVPSDAAPGAVVEVRVGDAAWRAEADARGLVRLGVPSPEATAFSLSIRS